MEVPPQSVFDPNPQTSKEINNWEMFISKLKTKQMKTFWCKWNNIKDCLIKPSFWH